MPLSHTQNTHLADIHELYTAFLLNGEAFGSPEEGDLFVTKMSLVGDLDGFAQCKRAQYGASLIRTYVQVERGGEITAAHWVSRPGRLSELLHTDYPSNCNPSDIVVALANNDFLGVSLKSHALAHHAVTFKNPGLSPVCKALGVDYWGPIERAMITLENEIPALTGLTAVQRKAFLRANAWAQQSAGKLAGMVLSELRDRLVTDLSHLSARDAWDLLGTHCLDVTAKTLPYLQVTTGSRLSDVRLTLADMTRSPIRTAHHAGSPLTFTAAGTTSIYVTSGETRLFRMRVKFASEKLASSLKLCIESP